jgi:hypothetical protein
MKRATAKLAISTGVILASLVCSADLSAAEATAVGVDGPGGGELVTTSPKGAQQELESSFEVGPESGPGISPKAVAFSGCIAPGKMISHRVSLPGGGSFLHRVTPDRSGFNVVMTINYPGLSRTVNKGGPGRAESFTVRTPSGKVSGKVKISGLKGSFGCYTFRVTP